MVFLAEPLALVSRPKLAVLRHLGVLLPDGRVAHCTPERGEHISSVEEFAAGRDVKIERVVAPDKGIPTLQRIAQAMRSPRGYNVATNNCEIFANRAVGEAASTPQLVGVVILIGLGLMAALN